MVQETIKLEGGIVFAQEEEYVANWLFFDTVTEHLINIQNGVTDNYLENNTAVQDCIAQNPITASVRGISGELVYTPPGYGLGYLYGFANSLITQNEDYVEPDKLTVIPALLPPVDNITQRAKNAVQYVEASFERYKKIYKNFTRRVYNKARLNEIYEELLALRNNNTLFTVITPYVVLNNMAITSIALSQGNVNYSMDIQIEFKQINYTDTQRTKPDEKRKAWYNAAARTDMSNHGLTTGQNVSNNTLLLSLYNVVTNTGVRRN